MAGRLWAKVRGGPTRALPVRLRSRHLFLLLAVAAILVAFAVSAALTHAAHENARKDAAVRHTTQVVALAVRAVLSNPLKLKWHRKPIDVIQYISVKPDQTSSFGRAFSWQGKAYSWPSNPFSGKPVTQSTKAGDYELRLIWWGGVDRQSPPDVVKVTGYGHDGTPLLTVTVSPEPQPIAP